MKYTKASLIQIARKVLLHEKVTVWEYTHLHTFTKFAGEPKLVTFIKRIAVPFSLLFGFLYTVFPHDFETFVASLPTWTNLPPALLTGVDYLWDIMGEPVKKANLVYHLPNVVLYAFGILGIKKLFDALDKRTWLDTVYASQRLLRDQTAAGNLSLQLASGHSVLFVGKGDFIGMQHVLDHKKDEAVTISETKPTYTDIWNFYDANATFDDLKTILTRIGHEATGEYIFFPVKDDQIFLPSPLAYDLSPHKLDILCLNIRKIEKELKWKPKRIIIVGDKTHHSYVYSEDKRKKVRGSEDVISLASIAKKYPKITLIDPTDIVLKEILSIAKGRKIVFRATREGIMEYKSRFYERLESLGYKHKATKKGVLTIGYDLFEDQTEQQTLSRAIDDYVPIVLSKTVRDALIRKRYKKTEFLYVPQLVLKYLDKTAREQ